MRKHQEMGPVLQLHENQLAVLKRSPLLRHLDDEVMEHLLDNATIRSYARRAYVPAADQSGELVSIVLSGSVLLWSMVDEGTKLVLNYLAPGDVVGLEFVARRAPGRKWLPSWAQAIQPVEICHIPAETISGVARIEAELAMSIVDVLSDRLETAQVRLIAHTYFPIKVRLAHLLARLARSQPHQAILVPHSMLAPMIGASREAVTRGLGELRQDGLIASDPNGRGIVVLDIEGLSCARW